MNRPIPYLFFILIILYGCREHLKIERNNNPQGYADSQVVGTWKVTAYTSDKPYDWDGNGTSETNIYATWSACQKDNLYVFVGDKTGTFKSDCNNNGPGAWRIDNTTHLVYNMLGQSQEAEKFISMTSVQFKTTKDITTSTGLNLTLTKTWSRQ